MLTGSSNEPVFLWIHDGEAELRDAGSLWGQEVAPTIEAFKETTGDASLSMAAIGPGGERLVKFACIALDGRNFMGRTGLGAVMGAKKLKGIAVSGNRRPDVYDKERISEMARWLRDNYKETLGTMQEMGTARGVVSINESGGLPTRNFREGSFEKVDGLTGRHMTDTILVGRESCYACPVRCKRVVEFQGEDYSVNRDYGGPEYETIAAFGSNCGVDDIKAVARANEICNANSVDTISAGMMIAGAMEAAEKGLLPKDLTSDLDLRFGSAKGMLTLLDMMVRRQGLGDILADGPGDLEGRIGPDAAACFLHVKGQPLPLHEPRFKSGMGVGYVVSPTGADHIHNMHDHMFTDETVPGFGPVKNMGILKGVDNLQLGPAKARLFVYMMLAKSVTNVLSLCLFMPYDMDMMVAQVKAATGWNVSNWELIKSSERSLNLARAFNSREGFTAEQDMLPDRFFLPLEGGPLKGQALDHKEFVDTRNLVYDMLGWDKETGSPLKWKLYELGLDWVADSV